MTIDLHQLVRTTYETVAQQQRNTTAAFERAVAILLEHDRLLDTEDARRSVARMLAVEPADRTR